MSEERKMILQMLSEGKINTDEADTLLQAIDESEQAAEEVVVKKAQRAERTADGLSGLGGVIDEALSEAARALDETFRSMEGRLKQDEAKQEQLRRRVEERIRRSTERALERALEAEERATRAAEQAAERVQERAERLAQKAAMKAGQIQERFVKIGVSIDKYSVERTEHMSLPAEPGDRLVLENRVGDIEVEFHEGQTIEVDLRMQVWGSDTADATARAEATTVELVRDGAVVKVRTKTPTISGIGVLVVKDTSLNYTVRVPHGTHLELSSKAGEIRVLSDGPVTTWTLETKAGDIDLQVPDTAGFQYRMKTKVGTVTIDLDEEGITGRFGNGEGLIEARTGVGDIRLHH